MQNIEFLHVDITFIKKFILQSGTLITLSAWVWFPLRNQIGFCIFFHIYIIRTKNVVISIKVKIISKHAKPERLSLVNRW